MWWRQRQSEPTLAWHFAVATPSSLAPDPRIPANWNQPTAADRRLALAFAAPWLAALLNVLPGLGAGYLYQRRWRPYWITSVLSTSWFALGAWLAQNRGVTQESDRLVGLAGLVLLALVTAAEAFLAGRRARMD